MIKIVPFFPDSPALEKKWWHRLMKVISTLVVVISGIGAAICFVLVLINTYAIVAGPGLIFRFTNTKTNQEYGVTADEYAQVVKEIYPDYKDLDNKTLIDKLKNKYGENVVNEDDLNTVIMEKGHTPASSLVPFGIFKTEAEANIEEYLPGLLFFIVALFVPTLFYRIILYILTGKF